MNRTLESKTTSFRETATHLGHKITFSYEISDGQVKPIQVNATAVKIEEGTSQLIGGGMVNINVSENHVNTNYPPTTPGELIRDIKNECLAIINREA